MPKRRITVTVDADLVEAASAAVEEGRAVSVSAWVNDAMESQRAHDIRRSAIAELIADYEAEYGVITQEEMDERRRLDKEAAEAVRREYLERA